LAVTGTVHNTGGRDGAEVVQVYARLPGDGVPERLVAFARVGVAAGAAAPFEVTVPLERLETRDPEAHCWRPPRGRYRLTVARHAEDPEAVGVEIDL
jgi:hypothetical protein